GCSESNLTIVLANLEYMACASRRIDKPLSRTPRATRAWRLPTSRGIPGAWLALSRAPAPALRTWGIVVSRRRHVTDAARPHGPLLRARTSTRRARRTG